MDVNVVGGGPGGLYASLLLKERHPDWDVTVYEQNPPDVTYGWGIVLPNRMPPILRETDRPSYESIRDAAVQWDPFDIYHQGTRIRCGGQTFSSLQRTTLLEILQDHCGERGVELHFEHSADPAALKDESDLVIGADGLPSDTRSTFADAFDPTLVEGRDPFAWFGTDRSFDALTHIYVQNDDGLWRAHAYPGPTSTFAVDCDPATFEAAGIESATESEYLDYLEGVFAPYLDGHSIRSKEDKWRRFVTVRNQTLQHENVILLGDAAHTAHYTVGSGTTIALEDAIALADAFDAHPDDLSMALEHYETERRPAVEAIQTAAERSRIHFENIKRYADMDPLQFAFLYFVRTGVISYERLRDRDPAFVNEVARWFADRVGGNPDRSPMHQPLSLRDLTLANRAVVSVRPPEGAEAGAPDAATRAAVADGGAGDPGLVLVESVAATPADQGHRAVPGLYDDEQVGPWQDTLDAVAAESESLVGAGLTVATTDPELEAVREACVAAAHRADRAGFDLLELRAHGGSALSPVEEGTRTREADSAAVEERLAFPASVVEAVREAWPTTKPLSVSIEVFHERGQGLQVEEAFTATRAFDEAGCDLVTVVPGGPLRFGPMEVDTDSGLYGHWIRNETGVPALSASHHESADDLNTALAAGRADLCQLTPPSDRSVSDILQSG